MTMLLALLVAAAASHLLNRLLLARAGRLLRLDVPNERSLHDRPVPRGGGLGIVFGALVGWGVWLGWVALVEGAGQGPAGGPAGGSVEPPWRELGALGIPALLVGIVSHVDDRRGLHAWVRLLVHVGAAAAFVTLAGVPRTLELPGMSLPLGPVAGPLFGGLLLVWMTNLYNFMDGMDGFAGGMTVIGFGTLALLWGEGPIGAVAAVAAGAALGFLPLNFPPARLFMGDVGSSVLGFLAGGLAILGWKHAVAPLWVSLLVFAPFVVDATVTLARRILRGERIWEAHRSHYYQRVVQLGWGHRRTVLLEYALMVAAGASALLAVRVSVPLQLLIVLVWVALFAVLARAVRLAEGRSAPHP